VTAAGARAVVAAAGVGVAATTVAAAVIVRTAGIDAAGSPITPPTAAGRAAFIAVVVTAFVLYACAAVLAPRAERLLPFALAAAAAIQLAPLIAPLLLSRDVHAYWDYGRLASVHHVNPYVTPPSAFPDDPAYPLMGDTWHDTPTIYGPVWTLVAAGHAAVVGDSPSVASYAYRILAAAALLAVVVLAAVTATERVFAAVFVGWNPLLALHFAGGGHNDALMLLLVVAGVALYARGRAAEGAAAWTVSIFVKWISAPLLLLHLVARRRRGEPLGARGAAVAAAAVAVVATAVWAFEWLRAFRGLSSQVRRTGSIGPAAWLDDLGVPYRGIILVLALAGVCAGILLLREARRGRARLALAACVMAFVQPWLNPWYAVWGVSLAAIERDRAARIFAVALTALLLRDALPF